MNIVPKLNLNKHPKDCENLSLTLAKNMMISGDMSCLTNEPGIKDISSIDDRLSDLFSGKWKIVGYIPCNDEVVLFMVESMVKIVKTIYLDTEKRMIIYIFLVLIGNGLVVI